MDDVATIARGLSKAQRECLLFLTEQATQIRHGNLTAAYLGWKGLVVPAGDWMANGRQYRLTPLGLRVRNHLGDTNV